MMSMWRLWCSGTKAVSEPEAFLSTSEVLITFGHKSDVCPSSALCNKNPSSEKTLAPLEFHFKKLEICIQAIPILIFFF